MSDKAEDWKEPWAVEDDHESVPHHWVQDRDGADRIGFVPSRGHNRPQAANRAVACVNFLAGVPTETVLACTKKDGEVQNEAAAMFLAFLRGDPTAALYADEVISKFNTPATAKWRPRKDLLDAIIYARATLERALKVCEAGSAIGELVFSVIQTLDAAARPPAADPAFVGLYEVTPTPYAT